MSFIKRHFTNIFNDKYLTISFLLSFIFVGLHIYQFIDSDFRIEPIIHAIISSNLPFVIFFGGKIATYWYWWICANLLAINTTFQNYTSFVVICIFISLVPKMKIPSLILYAIEIFFVATARDKTPVHIAIHICNCLSIYCGIYFLLRPTVKNLKLTNDEIYILNELIKGKQQKEIDIFSPNTVTNKLKQAKKRNKIESTDELIKKYKQTLPLGDFK